MAAPLEDLRRELAELAPLADDLTPANLARLRERLPALVEDLEAHLVERRRGPARMHALRANRLLGDALYREGVQALRARDHGRAERLLLAAGEERVAAALRLIGWSARVAVPSLDNEAGEAVREGWQACWELTKAQRGNGRWRAAEQALKAVAARVAADGPYEAVAQDLKAVQAKLEQVDLKDSGHPVRAALRGLRPDVRRAARPAPTVSGHTAATGGPPGPPQAPFFSSGNYERRTRGR
ncbi:hypothetical protein ACFPZ0_11870 [Streptomonospora nanhaiensis]|uniref:Uncharacterized protein n=1 Tax=Streptomonospora nanhaiensis TaxID=1323731 RepID=A0A853BJ74_9ACTN|nr:hypothetical protein [Streptomonospora nanhaiensis]MBX9388961.1 hypothetical protein [Streptomonospora nanhaiensis]NYI95323.1 hypothetical protein [Streptomonospora nanhaiensis]